MKPRHWIPLRATVWLASQTASAGATHALLIPCLSLRRDDGSRCGDVKIPNVIPAHAGIQCRSNFRSLDF